MLPALPVLLLLPAHTSPPLDLLIHAVVSHVVNGITYIATLPPILPGSIRGLLRTFRQRVSEVAVMGRGERWISGCLDRYTTGQLACSSSHPISAETLNLQVFSPKVRASLNPQVSPLY